jgi:hypothetical protein
MITKEKSPMRALFFRDHEVVGAGRAGRVTGAAIATPVSVIMGGGRAARYGRAGAWMALTECR